MPSAAEIRAQTARELHWRSRLAVPAFAGGFLYLLSSIIITSTLSGLPTVGLAAGLRAALGRRLGARAEPARGGGQIHLPPRLPADRREPARGDRDRVPHADPAAAVRRLHLPSPDHLAARTDPGARRWHRRRGREHRPPDRLRDRDAPVRDRARLLAPRGRTGAHQKRCEPDRRLPLAAGGALAGRGDGDRAAQLAAHRAAPSLDGRSSACSARCSSCCRTSAPRCSWCRRSGS